jgi:hypothetical protein
VEMPYTRDMAKEDVKSEAVKMNATPSSEPRKYKPFSGIKKPDVKVLKPGTANPTEIFKRLRGR